MVDLFSMRFINDLVPSWLILTNPDYTGLYRFIEVLSFANLMSWEALQHSGHSHCNTGGKSWVKSSPVQDTFHIILGNIFHLIFQSQFSLSKPFELDNPVRRAKKLRIRQNPIGLSLHMSDLHSICRICHISIPLECFRAKSAHQGSHRDLAQRLSAAVPGPKWRVLWARWLIALIDNFSH